MHRCFLRVSEGSVRAICGIMIPFWYCDRIRFWPAPVPNNNLTMRLEAVRQPLSEMIDGDPGRRRKSRR